VANRTKEEDTLASIIEAIEKEQMRDDRPAFRAGDVLKVHVKVIEGGKERIQVFEGICINRQREGIRQTFTVRKISHTVGVERTFMLHSPKIDKIEVVRRNRVRRAKLFYLREKVGKAARLKELR
jgi:large subunit ribosomal protein L19